MVTKGEQAIVQRPWARKHLLLARAEFDALRDALLTSPLIGASQLGGTFEATRGFAITFKSTGRTTVVERFPSLRPYLDAVLGYPAVKALTPWFHRVHLVPNCWYLNVLLVPEGGAVGAHVDATLRTASPTASALGPLVAEALPEVVSVLYLSVPPMIGGALALYFGSDELAVIQPEENLLLHFRGDLTHEVRPFRLRGDPRLRVRASLVIEQYHFEPSVLELLPDFAVDSRAGFEQVLDAHRASPRRPTFELG